METPALRDLFEQAIAKKYPSAADASRAVAALEEAIRRQIIEGVGQGTDSARFTAANRRALDSLLSLWRPRISWTVTHSLVKQTIRPDDPFEYYRSEYTLSIVTPLEKIIADSADVVKNAVFVGLDPLLRKGRDAKAILIDLQTRLANIFAADTPADRRRAIINLIEHNFNVKIIAVDSEDSEYFDDYIFDFTPGKPGIGVVTTVPAILSADGRDSLICRGTCAIGTLIAERFATGKEPSAL